MERDLAMLPEPPAPNALLADEDLDAIVGDGPPEEPDDESSSSSSSSSSDASSGSDEGVAAAGTPPVAEPLVLAPEVVGESPL
jgi:hypothetical protein